MTMTVEMCCGSGRRLTYRVAMNGTEMIMVVESPLDGKPFGTVEGTLSGDGRLGSGG
jgi:hypothetical protein